MTSKTLGIGLFHVIFSVSFETVCGAHVRDGDTNQLVRSSGHSRSDHDDVGGSNRTDQDAESLADKENSNFGCAGGQGNLMSEPPADCTLSTSLQNLRNKIEFYNSSGLLRGGDLGDAEPMIGGPSSLVETPSWEAFVVTLRRRQERLKGFIDALSQQEPWVLERLSPIWAVDGKLMATDKGARQTLVSSGFVEVHEAEEAMEEPLAFLWWDLSPGAIGCYMSHAMAWEQVVSRGLDYGLVFEDDTRHFSKEFGDAVKSRMLEKKGEGEGANGDIVYLQHCDTSANWPRGSDVAPQEPSSPHVLDSDLIVPCTAAYMISQKAARQLLRLAFPVKTQLDRALAGEPVKGLTRMRFEPALAQVGTASEQSDIQDTSAGISWFMNYMRFKLVNLFKNDFGADGVVSALAPGAAPFMGAVANASAASGGGAPGAGASIPAAPGASRVQAL